MSAPEDENELDRLQTLLQKHAACEGLNGVSVFTALHLSKDRHRSEGMQRLNPENMQIS